MHFLLSAIPSEILYLHFVFAISPRFPLNPSKREPQTFVLLFLLSSVIHLLLQDTGCYFLCVFFSLSDKHKRILLFLRGSSQMTQRPVNTPQASSVLAVRLFSVFPARGGSRLTALPSLVTSSESTMMGQGRGSRRNSMLVLVITCRGILSHAAPILFPEKQFHEILSVNILPKECRRSALRQDRRCC